MLTNQKKKCNKSFQLDLLDILFVFHFLDFVLISVRCMSEIKQQVDTREYVRY